MKVTYCIQRRNNALLTQIGVKIVWDTIDSMNGSVDVYLVYPAYFAGVDDIITNLAKESLGSRSLNGLPNP